MTVAPTQMPAEDARPDPQRWVVSDGLAIVGDHWGDPAHEPVLLLHGGGQNRHAWAATARKLVVADFFVVTVDARGHGDSEWDRLERYDMEDMARDLLELADRLGRPPAMVGASMGGMAALWAQGMVAPRQLFSSVTLVDVTPRMDLDGATRIMDFMTANPGGFDSLDQAADAIAAYNPHRPRSANTGGLTKVLRQGEDGRWRWRWDPAFMSSKAELMRSSREAAEARMDEMATQMLRAAATITQPALLVRGALSDLVTDDAVAEFQAAVPHSDYVDVRNAGHMVAGDDNDTFAAAIITFLDNCRSARTAR
ncbi:MAG: alpha/beta fold hydrolase [Acidimicrobiales bacterium]